MRALIAILVVVAIGVAVWVFTPVRTEQPKAPEPPCEELVWMRDSPQARCVEYWKQRNLEEQR